MFSRFACQTWDSSHCEGASILEPGLAAALEARSWLPFLFMALFRKSGMWTCMGHGGTDCWPISFIPWYVAYIEHGGITQSHPHTGCWSSEGKLANRCIANPHLLECQAWEHLRANYQRFFLQTSLLCRLLDIWSPLPVTKGVVGICASARR